MPAFKNVVSASVGTTAVSVLTATAATTVIGASIANTTTGAINVSVQVTSGATTVYMLKNAPVPVGSSLVAIGAEQKLVLEIGDILKITSNTATSADVIVSYLET